MGRGGGRGEDHKLQKGASGEKKGVLKGVLFCDVYRSRVDRMGILGRERK